ncbi:MAG: hypothetical protein Q4F34_08560, partial [Prevotellaceae bacterium]|nr:hypothetical protein [Prevotellaceae bacterium]
MKYFTLFLCCVATALFASAQPKLEGTLAKTKVPCANTVKVKPVKFGSINPKGFIDEQPAGELKTYKRTGEYYAEDWDGLIRTQQSGAAKIVFGENNKVYIENIVYTVNSGKWTEGTLSEDGKTITVASGQIIESAYVYVYNAEIDDYVSYEGKLKVSMVKAEETELGWKFTEDPTAPITYSVDGDVIKLNDAPVDVELLGAVYTDFPEEAGINGMWASMGDCETTYTLFTDELLTLPENVTANDFVMTYKDVYADSEKKQIVKMGFDGNDVYLGSFSTTLPDAWVKGTLEGGKVTFPSKQYIGVQYGYICYFMGGVYEVVPSFYGGTEVSQTFVSSLEFNYDAEKGTLTPVEDNYVINVNANDFSPYAFQSYYSPSFVQFKEVAATPADPEITQVEDYYDSWGYTDFAYNIPQTDVDGNYINPDKLAYVLYIDSDSPYTFTTEKYGVESDMTELPVAFRGSFVYETYFGYAMSLYEGGIGKVG